jgi:hypothetical protein
MSGFTQQQIGVNAQLFCHSKQRVTANLIFAVFDLRQMTEMNSDLPRQSTERNSPRSSGLANQLSDMTIHLVACIEDETPRVTRFSNGGSSPRRIKNESGASMERVQLPSDA